MYLMLLCVQRKKTLLQKYIFIFAKAITRGERTQTQAKAFSTFFSPNRKAYQNTQKSREARTCVNARNGR